MTFLQKFIKFSAIGFGVFLIASVALGILGLFSGTKDLSDKEVFEVEIGTQEISGLSVELAGVEFSVQTGDSFKVETNNDKVNVSVKNGTLTVKEPTHWFNKTSNGKLILTLPDVTLFHADFEIGAGKVTVEKLSASTVDFDFGAGEVEIGELIVERETEIECGAGKVTFHSGRVSKLDMDLGVGQVNLSLAILGTGNEINCGVGELNLNLGKKSEYKLEINKGLGAIKVDGKEYSDFGVGGGENELKIDGGIGEIDVRFEEE